MEIKQVVSTPEMARTELDDYILNIAWLPDNKHIVVGDTAGYVQVFDVETNEVVSDWQAHDGMLALVASPNQPLAVTGGQDGKFKLWNTQNAQLVAEHSTGAAWAECAAWSPDGQYCVIGGGKYIIVMRANGEIIYRSNVHESTVSGIAWHPSSQRFATACFGGVRIFNVDAPEIEQFLVWKNSMVSISWSPDGQFLGCGTQDSRVHFFPLPYTEGSDFEMSGYRGKVKLLEWDSKGDCLLTNCWDEVVIWNFEDGSPQGQVPWTLTDHTRKITAMRYQNKGNCFATADEQGGLFFYKATEEDLNLFAAYNTGVAITTVSWSFDDKYIAFGTVEGEVLVMQCPQINVLT